MSLDYDIENPELIDLLKSIEGISVKNMTNKYLYLDMIHNKAHSLDEVDLILDKYRFQFEIINVLIYDGYTRVHLLLKEKND